MEDGASSREDSNNKKGDFVGTLNGLLQKNGGLLLGIVGKCLNRGQMATCQG